MKKVIISICLISGILLFPFIPLLGTVSHAKDGIGAMENYKRLNLSKDAQILLEKNGFVVVPTKAYKDMTDTYEASRKDNLPIFLTTDSVLHTTHLLFDFLLRTIEISHLMSNLNQLTESMLKASIEAYKKLEDKEVKKAVYSNIAFFSVASRLLNDRGAIPQYVKNIVEEEVALIQNHKGFQKSPIFGYLEDYSQYVPRGHYNVSEEFKSYFKAMMWYGRMGFYLNPSESLQITEGLTKQLTRQALLIVKALNDSRIEGKTAFEVWEKIYEPTTFFVGKTDDLDVHDYRNIALKIYGKILNATNLVDESRLERFMSEARRLRKPKILSTFVVDSENNKKGNEEITLGFRFMGQRFILDSYVFQNLVYPKVMFYTGKSRPFTWVMSQRGPIRGFPRGLDIMAVLGSMYAEEVLREEGDSDYERYNEQLEKLKKEFDLKKEEWSSNLYWIWLYCLKPLLTPSGCNFPTFMHSKAWKSKELNTALGSWAELRHDTILYAKQSYTMLAGGLPPQPKLTYGYVEPCPEVYARVREMVEMMRKGLISRKLLDNRIEDNLIRYERLLVILETISKKELTGKALTEDENETIWNIGSLLKSVTKFPDEIMSKITSGTDERMALIADVHTDPNSGQVLEEAVGFPFIIYVKVSIKGKDQIVQGPVFSYYEFKQPMSDRLTDEKWQSILKAGKEPSLPKWTSGFIGK
jgi:hypothetical protein